MKTKLVFCFTGVVSAGTLALLAFCPGCGGKGERTNELADITWEREGSGAMVIQLRDQNGAPIPEVIVDTQSYSGYDGNSTPTDAKGKVSLQPGEREVLNVMVNRVALLDDEDYLFSDYSGIVMNVIVKDPSAVGLATRQRGSEQEDAADSKAAADP